MRHRGVTPAALVGSFAPDERKADGNIDIMFETASAASAGVHNYLGIVPFIADLFATRVNIVEPSSLKHYVRPLAERDGPLDP